MRTAAALGLTLLLAASCSCPRFPPSPEPTLPVTEPHRSIVRDRDVEHTIDALAHLLDWPWVLSKQLVVPIQVDGFEGSLPEHVLGKDVVRIQDARLWIYEFPDSTALRLKVEGALIRVEALHFFNRNEWTRGVKSNIETGGFEEFSICTSAKFRLPRRK